MADYPITAVTRRKVYSGSAGVGPYAFTFPILVQTDIVVYKNSTLLTLTTDYTVTINGTNGTGSVTLVSAASASDTITIIGARAIQRTTDFVTAGDLAASSLNEQLDANIIMTQQLAEENKRTLKAPPYDPEATVDGGTLNMTLPAKADRAGKVLAFDADGNPSAGAVSLPASLTATYYPRVNTGGTAYELRAPASVRSDIGADNASNLTSGTVSDSRLPSTIDGKTITNVTITSGSITGITDLAVADGGTGASNAATARSNLGAAASGTNADITSMTAIMGGVSSPDFIQFDTGAGATTAVGKLFWNNTDGTLDVGLKGGNVTLQIGQENVLLVRNDEATTLSDGEVVYVSGANGTNILVKRADASSEAQSATVIGVVTETITSGSTGFITTFGIVRGLNTSGFSAGDALYLSTTAGGITNVKPTAPDHLVLVGYCVKSSAGNGEIFVEPQNGYELDELHNVYINSVANNDVLVYDSTDKRWENKAQSTLTAGSVNGSATITSGTISGITALSVAGTASSTGEIKLYEDTDNGTNYVSFKAPTAITADVAWTLPAADGAAGQFLGTNGSGTLSWSTPSGAGDVVGAASSTDNALVRFDGTSGKAIQNSSATLSDTGVLTATEVSTDTISEKTAAAGVTIDSVVLKDGGATLTAPVILADGSASAPSVTNTGDTNTGMYFPAADEVAITAGGTVAAAFNSHSFMGMRNRIINGDMRIDQRATTTTTSGAYTVDRFQQSQSAASAVVSWAQSTIAPTGFTNSLGGTVTTAVASVPAGAFYRIYQPVEGVNVADLGLGTSAAQTVTLSFWVRSSVAGTYCVGLQNATVNRSYAVNYTISAANVWEYKTITIALDTTGTWRTDNQVGIYVYWDLGSGSDFNQTNGVWAATNTWKTSAQTPWITTSGATFYLTGVQLEVGSVATPFERRQYGQELALCQRFYTTGTHRFGSGVTSTGQIFENSFSFKQTMRTTPTMTFTDTYSNSYGASTEVIDPNAFSRFFRFSSTAQALLTFTYTASAEL